MNIPEVFSLTDEEQKELELNGWECTDPDCNQWSKEILKDRIYKFREDRLGIEHQAEINLEHYTLDHIVKELESFDYTREQIELWLIQKENCCLVAECLFELDSIKDNLNCK